MLWGGADGGELELRRDRNGEARLRGRFCDSNGCCAPRGPSSSCSSGAPWSWPTGAATSPG